MAIVRSPDAAATGVPEDAPAVLSPVSSNGVAVPYSAGTVLAVPAFFDLIVIGTPEGGMYVWQRSIVDGFGSLIPSARVEVRDATNNILADLFVDLEGNTPLSNPFLADLEGFARFYAQAGTYTITASSAGLERVWEDVLLGVRLVDMPPELAAFIAQQITPAIDDRIDAALEEFLAAHPSATGGYVAAGVTGSSLPAGWSVQHTATAHYQLTAPVPPDGYRWSVTANVIANDDRWCNIAEGLTSRVITVQVVDAGSGGVDDDFLFLAQLVPA